MECFVTLGTPANKRHRKSADGNGEGNNVVGTLYSDVLFAQTI
jgi:hypothetical protein